MFYDLAIVIPGIRNENWPRIFGEIEKSVGSYAFQVIAVGPNLPESSLQSKKNFTFHRDFGSPTRCLQIGALLANSSFICWLPDDIKLEEDSLKKCIDLMRDLGLGHAINLRYSEGTGFTGNQSEDESYWIGRTHRDQQLPGVKEGWKISPVFFYRYIDFMSLGGLDCRFEHINFNTHDLAYRFQHKGGVIHNSPTKVFSADWTPNDSVISRAHHENDLPLFQSMYSSSDVKLNVERHVSFYNWKLEDTHWKRRNYGQAG